MKFDSPRNCRQKLAHTAILLSLTPLSVAAGASSSAQSPHPALKEMVVTATRNAATADEVSLTATTVSRQELDRRMPADEADLFRDEPDVSMARDLRRHGATRVNIRGIEDNRIVQMVDGVRLGDFYNGGGPTNFTMSASPTAMPDFLKRVEIVRGAASSLYGSDAIGGVVGYVTLDPADLLSDGKNSGFRLRASYLGANQGSGQTLLGAMRGEQMDFLLGYSRIGSKEFDNQGNDTATSPSRSAPNPIKVEDQGLLAKLSLRVAPGHQLSATLEGRDQSADSTILRLSGSLPKMIWVHGDDNARRLRGSLEWTHVPVGGLFYDRLTARVFHQEGETRNFNFQQRTNTSVGCSAAAGSGNNCYVESDFSMDQTSTGANLQFESALKTGGLDHLLTYGADIGQVRIEELRDARIWNRTTGAFTKSLAGETYPLRDFANGKTDTIGLFAQDEIAGLADGQLSLTPGLRYDRTRLKPEMDAIAQQVLTLIGRQAAEKTYGALSPKLGAIWRFTPQVSSYGQIARGFRAPNYKEVNGVFRNTSQQYGVTPNPTLEPETSIGVELGLRLHTNNLRSQLNVYDNRYKDFIESIKYTGCNLASANPNCIAGTSVTYQSVNFKRVRIYGAEARVKWDVAPGWMVGASLAYAKGSNEETGQPLDSVEPTRLAASLARDFGPWGVEARLQAASRKSRVDDTAGKWFRTSGYGVADVSAWWKIDRRTQVNLAVNNLFDKKYWLWSDIRQADAYAPLGVDFYTQPGRHLNVAVQMDF